jgi:chromosomal replication initiator protein
METYAAGPGNRLARAAAQAVIEIPAGQFNPLYIHAGIGLGKTHLLHAIGNACAEGGRQVLFVSAETFTNDLVAAIRTHRTSEFREKYRTPDILLVDDIQFIAGKESSQEEFYHTFNTLFECGAQIIASGDEPPGAVRRLDSRLASRFEGGLVVEIQPPDFPARLEILQLKAEARGFGGRIPLEVLETIAEEAEGSVRELEGALNQIIATAMLTHELPTLGLAEQALARMGDKHGESSVGVGFIAAVAEYYKVSPDDLAGRDRSREVSIARQMVIYLAREVAVVAG